jgi:hypothetical protein
MDPGRFEGLLVDLARADVRYLVVGGIACILNGYMRTTEDVDLLIDSAPENVRKLIERLSTHGEGHGRELRPEDFADEEGAVRLVEDFDIDLFTRMGGRRYADLLPYRKVHRAAGADIPFIDARGLILLKEGSVRGRDKLDVEYLREMLRRGGADGK